MKTVTFLFLLIMLLGTVPALAGVGAGAILYSFNTSARYEGMGGAGVGSPWGGATNHWANPAQLAYRKGIQWEWFRSELAKGLADDIALENNEFIVGFGGVSVLWGRTPAGGLYLDMGTQILSDEGGQPVGFVNSYMQSESYGLAADVVQIFDHFDRKSDRPRNLSRYGSLSFGYVHKDFEDKLDLEKSSANTYDFGWVIGVTPLNTMDDGHALGFLLGASYGSATLNGGDEVIRHFGVDQHDPLPRAHVSGWSFHWEMSLVPDYWRRNAPGFLVKFHDTFNPLLSWTRANQTSEPGYVWDPNRQVYVYERDTQGGHEESGNGWEIGLGNIYYIRRGHIEAVYGFVDDDTEGWGINLQAGDMLGFRYDKATVPQARGLPPVERETWMIWVNPLAFCGD